MSAALREVEREGARETYAASTASPSICGELRANSGTASPSECSPMARVRSLRTVEGGRSNLKLNLQIAKSCAAHVRTHFRPFFNLLPKLGAAPPHANYPRVSRHVLCVQIGAFYCNSHERAYCAHCVYIITSERSVVHVIGARHRLS